MGFRLSFNKIARAVSWLLAAAFTAAFPVEPGPETVKPMRRVLVVIRYMESIRASQMPSFLRNTIPGAVTKNLRPADGYHIITQSEMNKLSEASGMTIPRVEDEESAKEFGQSMHADVVILLAYKINAEGVETTLKILDPNSSRQGISESFVMKPGDNDGPILNRISLKTSAVLREKSAAGFESDESTSPTSRTLQANLMANYGFVLNSEREYAPSLIGITAAAYMQVFWKHFFPYLDAGLNKYSGTKDQVDGLSEYRISAGLGYLVTVRRPSNILEKFSFLPYLAGGVSAGTIYPTFSLPFNYALPRISVGALISVQISGRWNLATAFEWQSIIENDTPLRSIKFMLGLGYRIW